MERAEFVAVDLGAGIFLQEKLGHLFVDGRDGLFAEQAARHPRLIAERDDGKPEVVGAGDGARRAGNQSDRRRIAEVAVAGDERVVTIEEDGGPFH